MSKFPPGELQKRYFEEQRKKTQERLMKEFEERQIKPPSKLNPTIHKLKTWTSVYPFVETEIKKFEIRKNDRGFNVGDYLELQEYNPESKAYTGKSCFRIVDFILDGGQFGIEEGYVVMSISKAILPPITSEIEVKY